MKTVKINVDYPSCKANGFYSEEFIAEIKQAFSESDYALDFNATAEANKGYYDNGISSIEYTGDVSGKEISYIQDIATTIFLRLTAKNMVKLSRDQFEKVLESVLFVFESNYHQFSFTDDSKKAFKFMAQGACNSLASNTECDPDIINPILKEALKRILNK